MQTRSKSRWLICLCGLWMGLFGAQPRVQSLSERMLNAVANGDVAAVAALLEQGVDPRAPLPVRANIRTPPIYMAAELKNAALVKLLLDHGADPDTKNVSTARTPLRLASLPGDSVKTMEATAEMLKALMEKGAGADGESLLALISGGRIDVARTIVGWGRADPSYLNLALATARQARQWGLVDVLVKAGAKEPGPIDQLRAPERLGLMEGVYRSPSGQELVLRLHPEGNQVVLERAGRDPVSLDPVDLILLRSLDRSVVATRQAGPLPPPEVTLTEGGRSDVFARTAAALPPARTAAAAPAAPRVAPPAGAPRSAATTAASREWPSFRGPSSSGVMDGANPPTDWDVEKGINVQWKTPIPGFGHGSPISWGNRVFVVSAVAIDDAEVPFLAGLHSLSTAGSTNRTYLDPLPHTWRVYALDRQTGEIVWERVAKEGVPRLGRHMNQSQADSTPVTDGTHVVAWFGSEGLYCYDFDGTLLWEKDLGLLRSGYMTDPAWDWNTSTSLTLYKNLVILQADLLEDSFITAVGLRTGEEVWRTERDEVPSWSTPLLYEGPTRTELITIAPLFARAYDPETGTELWRLGNHSSAPAATPIAGRGLIFLTSSGTGTVEPIYALRPGATGDITLKGGEASNEWVVWSKNRGGPPLTTPILYGDLLYIMPSTGSILTAYQAETGERLYRTRLTPYGGTFAASPVAADGKLYFSSQEGEVIVVKAGPTFERLAINPVGEAMMATPAIAPGMLILRTQHSVIAVAESAPGE